MKKILCLSLGLISAAPLFGMVNNNLADLTGKNDLRGIPITIPVDDAKANPKEIFITPAQLTPIEKIFYPPQSLNEAFNSHICRDNQVTYARDIAFEIQEAEKEAIEYARDVTFKCEEAQKKAIEFEKSKNDNKEAFLRFYKNYPTEYEARKNKLSTTPSKEKFCCEGPNPAPCIVYNGSKKSLKYLSVLLCCTYETAKCPIETSLYYTTCCYPCKPCNYEMTIDAIDNLQGHNAVTPTSNIMQ